ncbi:MAG: right-handed parallel beta-helix repeat-containing protein [Bacteroidales bacterium]|nr:right-handed parallel beta-helix repeat-containing protein [Bacteroidales bacterium]
MKKNILIILALLVAFSADATVYIVTNTGDSGSGSLRDALTQCSNTAGPHTIRFNIPTTDVGYNAQVGVWTISPATTYPYIQNADVSIDGSSQTTFCGNTNPLGPEIVIDGGDIVDYGFRFMNAARAKLKDLCICCFTEAAQFYNSPHSTVTGCYIGIDPTGAAARGNYIGLEFISGSDNCTIGGNTLTARNVISGNEHIGIRLLDVRSCTVSANLIGTDRTGAYAVPNADGMSMEGAVQYCTIGGLTAAERNIISGNLDYGLPLFGVGATGNVIVGNYIGTDITGSYAIGNTYGVLCDDGSFSNRVGGPTAAERNIISGNVGYGIFLYNNGTSRNLIQNNYIGTDHAGLQAVPNTAGIIIDGISYSNIIDSNIISGNLQSGIGINITGSDSNRIVRNRIGVNVAGQPLPNGMDGIRISQGPVATQIGGSPSEANIIAHNGACGVYITNPSCVSNRISCNSFHDNGSLAIDLYQPGVSANDPGDGDAGANNLMNYPEILSVSFNQTTHTITGKIDTPNPSAAEIQIYVASVDYSAHGEGMIYLKSVTPAATGDWVATVGGYPSDTYFTALSIDPRGNTSEFALSVSSSGPAEPIDLPSTDPDDDLEGISPLFDESSHLSVYPNPTTGRVCVKSNDPTSSPMMLYSVDGRLLQCIEANSGTLDLSSYPQGVYILRAECHSFRIIKLWQ